MSTICASRLRALAISTSCRWAMESLRTGVAGSMLPPTASKCRMASSRTFRPLSQPNRPVGSCPSRRLSSTVSKGRRVGS